MPPLPSDEKKSQPLLVPPKKKFFHGSAAGAGWMLLACILYTLLSITIKQAGQHFSLPEIMFYRNIFTALFGGYLMFKQKHNIITPYWKLAIILGLLAASSNLTYGYGLIHLPFSLANTLNYTHPIFLALFGVLFLKLPITSATKLTLLCSFFGVVLLLQPKSLPSEQWIAGCVALFSGFLAGFLNLTIYRLNVLGEPSARVMGYFGTIAAFITAMIVLQQGGFTPLLGNMWIYALLLGALSAGAQWFLVRSFQSGDPAITSLFSYSTILYSVILDITLFHKNALNAWSYSGIALILASGLIITWFNPRPPAASTVAKSS
ncbi:MAG: DMT family transporter [Pseudomonadota bacterium]